MHLFRRADDGVDRAGLDTKGAADAMLLFDQRQGTRFFDTAGGVERDGRQVQQICQGRYSPRPARRAAVDRGLALGHGLRVGHAAGVTALAALGLRQQGIDAISADPLGIHSRYRATWKTPSAPAWPRYMRSVLNGVATLPSPSIAINPPLPASTSNESAITAAAASISEAPAWRMRAARSWAATARANNSPCPVAETAQVSLAA